MAETLGRQFKPGNPYRIQPGHPLYGKGRRPNSRQKLSDKFVEAVYSDFEVNGADAVVKAREADPIGYLRIIASLMPRDIRISHVDELTPEQIDERLANLLGPAAVALIGGRREEGSDRTIDGEAVEVERGEV